MGEPVTPARTLTLLRLTAGGLVALFLTGSTLALVGAAAEEAPAEPPSFAYTLLGRGYAVVTGYPADEVPGRDDGGEEEEEPAEPPPAQTCPEEQRGVPEDVQARLDALAEVEREPVTPAENEVPTPRGQPIKFDFGLADASLRSDPGSHAIAAFFYVDLGGGQDPWTSSEADGYASGHAREEERCGQPYFGRPGDASEVHVISRASDDPAAFAFAQSQQQELPGGMSVRESITVADMDGASSPARARVTTIVSGVAFGELSADEVVTDLTYVTDGTEAGTTITASTQVSNLSVAGLPVELDPGAPPVAVGTLLVGVAAPEVRELPNGRLEITAGGLYVAGEAENPVGLQSKQATFIGGAWLDASMSELPSLDSGALPPPPAPPMADDPVPGPGTTDAATLRSGGFSSDPVDVTTDTAGPDAAPPPVVSPPAPESAEPTLVAAGARLGVYRGPSQVAGPFLLATGLLGGLWFGSFVWARHRYPEIRAALGTPLFAWLDGVYRSFLRG